jgi:hypothetical protein
VHGRLEFGEGQQPDVSRPSENAPGSEAKPQFERRPHGQLVEPSGAQTERLPGAESLHTTTGRSDRGDNRRRES